MAIYTYKTRLYEERKKRRCKELVENLLKYKLKNENLTLNATKGML